MLNDTCDLLVQSRGGSSRPSSLLIAGSQIGLVETLADSLIAHHCP